MTFRWSMLHNFLRFVEKNLFYVIIFCYKFFYYLQKFQLKYFNFVLLQTNR